MSNVNGINEWKSVIVLAIGAVLAAVAGLAPKADPLLMSVAIMIIGGALGLSVPGGHRDPRMRERQTDVDERPPSSGR